MDRGARYKITRCLYLVDHQFEMNGTSSIGAIVVDVASPSFAFNVDQNSSYKK